MSPKIKSKWLSWLSPGSLFPKSGKELEFDTGFGVNDYNSVSAVVLKGGGRHSGTQPQFLVTHPQIQFNKVSRRESRMMTISSKSHGFA